jgi:integrase
MTNPSKQYKDRPVPTTEEIDLMLSKADKIDNEYFKLRAKAVLCLISVFGRRRFELTLLTVEDLTVEGELLNVNFTIAKKKKLGLHQYLKWLEGCVKKGLITAQAVEAKSFLQLKQEHKIWVEKGHGIKITPVKALKQVGINEKYGKPIYEYYQWLKLNHPECKYFFPATWMVFNRGLSFNKDKAISGVTLWRDIKALDRKVWLHLFRKLKGNQTAKQFGRNLESIKMVADTLNISEQTAYHYVEMLPKRESGEVVA